MKRWHALLPNWAISITLILILVLNLISSYFEFFSISNVVTLVLIPMLLVAYFNKQKFMANVFFTIFFFYFLGGIFSVFDDFALSSKLSESSFLGAYALLTFVMMGKLRHVKFEGVVSWYLIIVLLINSYLMYAIFTNVHNSFNDSVNFSLSIGKGIVLLMMAFLAFAIYLWKETAQAIIFLVTVCCFVFAEVLRFTTTLYVQFWVFEGFQKTLQGFGLFLLCVYIFNHQELTKGVNSIRNTRESIAESNQLTV